jgi:hypothetical protein
MALKVVNDHCLLVGRIIFGILHLIDKTGFGLCKQLIKINFFSFYTLFKYESRKESMHGTRQKGGP